MPLRLIEAFRPIRRRPLLGYAAGLGLFLAAFLVSYLASELLENVPFITLFPAILLAALVGGLQVGLLVAVLGFLAAWYLFLPPHDSWQLEGASGYLALLLFCVTAAIQLYVIDALNRAVDRLSDERDSVAVLFRELQHRVANNMAFLASLLRLQSRTITSDPRSAAEAFEQAEQRIHTMARIHRRLYDPKIVELPLATYIEGLAGDVLEASEARNVTCVVDMPPIALDLTRLVTISLLVNEAIVNAIKHGFAGRDSGVILIKMAQQGSNIVLTIADDGRGFDVEAARGGTTLGMMILTSLAEQLRGELGWSNEGGTTVRLVFPA